MNSYVIQLGDITYTVLADTYELAHLEAVTLHLKEGYSLL